MHDIAVSEPATARRRLPLCSPLALLNRLLSDRGVAITSGLAYGPLPRHRLDLYRPEAASGPLPVILFLYGGSWKIGNRADYRFLGIRLAREGFAVAIADYRLYPEVRFPDFLEDCAAATAWVAANAARFGADPGAITLAGHSAGAYNAVMLGLDPEWLAAAGWSRERLRGIIGLAGPYDFAPGGDLVREVFASAADPAITQPVHFVDGSNPPLLLLTGRHDWLVHARNSSVLATKVRAAGGPVHLKSYRALGHIGIMMAFAPLPWARRAVVRDVVRFAATPRVGP